MAIHRGAKAFPQRLQNVASSTMIDSAGAFSQIFQVNLHDGRIYAKKVLSPERFTASDLEEVKIQVDSMINLSSQYLIQFATGGHSPVEHGIWLE